ncbi:MAG: metallophosphoesterase [Anaerotignum sp.]|nr:metallophosphoesterase [Anaerotignum sp.]MBP3629397.1 metallophosphoesterase [Anaerotignum sp.]
MKYKKTIGCICGGLLLAAFLYWQDNGLMLTKMTYEGDVPKAFDGYKILQVADLQNKVFGRDQAPLLKKINASSPDIIVITGDLLDRHEGRTDVDSAMGFIQEIKNIAPVYFVSGNHEHQSGEWDILLEELIEAGVTVLDNGKSILEKDGETITVLGLADKSVNQHYDKMLHTLMAGQEDSFNILLSHRPELFETYVKENIDLAFTGHAHGGQIIIPFLRQGIFAPHQGFFPKYTEGMHEKDGTVMVVSRGLGNSSFPFRIFNRPELIEVTLTSK